MGCMGVGKMWVRACLKDVSTHQGTKRLVVLLLGSLVINMLFFIKIRVLPIKYLENILVKAVTWID
jgi:hypothetical protein